MRPARLERATFWFVAKRSIQLSYGRVSELLILHSLRFSVKYRSILAFVYLDVSAENWKPFRQSPQSRIVY
jgi:hypothetical protein